MLQGRDFSNLTFVTNQAATAPVARAQLPALVAGFTGRETETAKITALLHPTGNAGAVVVSAMAGLAGVGKTALAVKAGHAARQAGWFPGGVLFVDLHGYDDGMVQPGQALDALLRALGVTADHIPPSAEERAGLYRSVLTGFVLADSKSLPQYDPDPPSPYSQALCRIWPIKQPVVNWPPSYHVTKEVFDKVVNWGQATNP